MRPIHQLLLLFLFFSVLSIQKVFAQDLSPAVYLKNINGKIIIKWKTDYRGIIKTINIQRSYDSLKNFTTIGTVPDPQKTENEFVDAKAPYNNMYYRIFMAFEGGNYIFSKAGRPGKPVIEVITSYPSNYVYTGEGNNVIVALPNAETKKYMLRFFDENNKMIFELNKLHYTRLIIEKVNFVHTGWFYFDLYENGKLLEKNKVNIPGDK